MTHPAVKRSFDLLCASAGVAVLSPLLLLLAVWIKCADRGPVFFRQERVGRHGTRFRIWKFRTMVVGAEKIGMSVTKDGDPRITSAGRVLRKTKLDELPQLLNVIAGEMSLVGPRPEVPRYVEKYSDTQREVLELKPGITDLATLEFRNEEDLLKRADDVERFYVDYCIPTKIALNLQYARRSSFCSDLRLIFETVFPALHKPAADPAGNADRHGSGSAAQSTAESRH